MNNLLPNIDELEKIIDSRQTFSETPMIKDFVLLSEEDKLQVLTDIVKQSMIYSKFPNPENDVLHLIGDDYTSSKAFINYMNKLNLFMFSKLVICSSRKGIDLKDYNTTHFAVVVTDINNNKYLVDTTPDVGYGLGKVNDVDIYDSLVDVNDDLDKFINLIRKSMYEINKGIYNYSQIEIFNNYKKYFYKDYFNGILLKYGECINNSYFKEMQMVFDREFDNKFNDLKKLDLENKKYKIKTLVKWKEQLKYLQKYSRDDKTKQMVAQMIIGEQENNLFTSFFDKRIKLSNLTPRLFWEVGANVVLIKPSSYLAGVSSSVIEHMIPNRTNIITSYDINLGAPSLLGLNSINYFHPHGIKYQKQMEGPTKIILVKDNAKILNARKHFIRENFVQKINGKYVNWFDGSNVLWNTDLNTNLVHSTDDAAETSIHFLVAYPEYQSFTRYNYPNPRLRKEKK